MPVAVVTDSTAYLPQEAASHHRLTVVPVPVSINGVDGREGLDVSPADVARALDERRVHVSTSRPSPDELAEVYRDLLDGGADGIVSVHLSARLSGTFEAAQLAAKDFGDRVRVVDSANAGMGTGFCVLVAARAASSGLDLDRVTDRAERTVQAVSTFFYVDTLEFLRRGGRIGAASALLGTALAVKPILGVYGGEVMLRDRVRTATRARLRLVELAVESGQDGPVEIAVHHLAMPDRAEAFVEQLRDEFGDRLRRSYISEVGAAVAAHCGPGLLGAVVHRLQ